MTQVRTAFTPDTVIDVPDAEADQLQAQGLLHSREHPAGTEVPKDLKPWRGEGAATQGEGGDVVTDAEPTETTTKKKG